MKRIKWIAAIPLSIVVLLFVAPISVVQAQRLHIPSTGMTPAPTAMTPSTPGTYSASPGAYGSSTYGAPSTYATVPSGAPATTYGGTPTPYNNVTPTSPYGSSSSIATPYPYNGAMSNVPVTGGNVSGPMPSFQSQPPALPAGWDPYAAPGTTPTPTLLSPDYYPEVPTLDLAVANQWRQEFLDELRLDYNYLPARGAKRFGTNDLDLSATFAFPFLYNSKSPLLVTPGFAFHWWEGPVSSSLPPGSSLNYLPPRVYDAYLDTAWNPQLPGTPISGELCFRIGVYSDFKKVTAESIRYTGQGLGVITFSSALKAKLGIVYYDRIKVKLLPAGGLVWTPNENVRFDILFPNPMFSRRMKALGTVDVWVYLRGEYGGGSWVLTPAAPMDQIDQYDYNDLRAALGVEFDNETGLDGLIEVGIAFERELVVRSTGEEFSPSTTIFLRAGASY